MIMFVSLDDEQELHKHLLFQMFHDGLLSFSPSMQTLTLTVQIALNVVGFDSEREKQRKSKTVLCTNTVLVDLNHWPRIN